MGGHDAQGLDGFARILEVEAVEPELIAVRPLSREVTDFDAIETGQSDKQALWDLQKGRAFGDICFA